MKKVKLSEIIKFLKEKKIDFRVVGEQCNEIYGFASLNNYKENCITWIKSESAIYTGEKEISMCVAQEGCKVNAKTIIWSKDSKQIFFSILEEFFGDSNTIKNEIGKGSIIGEDVKLGDRVIIGNNCTIIGDIKIGANTIIGDNVVIRNSVDIGNSCVIQSLTVIGEDGFGYSENEKGAKTMVKHYGGVEIGDNVFIGSHTNIARGTIDNTIISNGVKIAPTTHIGHNIFIDENATIICSQVFGSVKIGKNAYVTSSVVRNQCCVGENSLIGMGSVVTKNIGSHKIAIGSPAREIRENN